MDTLTINDPRGGYPKSWYAETAEPLAEFPRAEGEMQCDVCVVGGGFTGLSAALHMARAGLDVVLLEAHRVGFGASGRNGGQVGTGQRRDQMDLETMAGPDDAAKLWDLGLEAVALTKSLADACGSNAGFKPGILHPNHKARYTKHSRAEVDHLTTRYGYEQISFLDRGATQAEVGSPGYHSATLDMGGGHLHPLRYALGLAKLAQAACVRIHENSRMTARVDKEVRTDFARVRAGAVVLALNGYHTNIDGTLAKRVMPINNFTAATAPLAPDIAAKTIRSGYAVADSRFVVNYFRLSHDKRLLFGGGESYGLQFPTDIAAKVRRSMAQVFPHLKDVPITHAWGGTLGITMERLPHFARLSPDVWSASGFSGHGVAMGTLAGKILAEAVGGTLDRFDLMNRLPTPTFPGGVSLRWPLLVAAMTWYALRDRL
ncbi:MAG: FAD-binding oxidoreductase [Pseudomonadota bacterium]